MSGWSRHLKRLVIRIGLYLNRRFQMGIVWKGVDLRFSLGVSATWILIVGAAIVMCVPLLAVDVSSVSAEPYDPTTDQSYRGWTVASLELQGIRDSLARRIVEGLALSGQNGLLGTKKAKLYPDPLVDDLNRVRLFLARRGYPDAIVSADVVPDRKTRTVVLRIVVDPGTVVTISDVRLRGVPLAQKAEARIRLGLMSKQRFDEDAMDTAAEAVRSYLASEGYARAAVEVILEESIRDAGGRSGNVPVPIPDPSVTVIFDVRSGPLCSFGRVDVTGIEGDLVPLAKRTLGIERGMQYAPNRVQSAEDRLRSLDLFRQVNLKVTDAHGFDPNAAEGTVDVICQLVEQPQRRVETGVGYRTDELIRSHASWEHRNLFRRGRGVRVSGLYSLRRRNVRSGFWWPALFKVNVRADLAGRLEWLREEGFDSDERGARLSLAYRPSFATTYEVGVELLQFEIRAKSDFEAFARREETDLELSTQWTHSDVNNRPDPSIGSDSWIRVRTLIPTGLSASRFVLLEASHARYFHLAESAVVAGRVRAGWARPWGETTELAPNNRFFAGGVTSMRGFRRSRLGPADPNGTPLGGTAKLEAGLEMRFPIWGAFRGAAFLDLGQVWADPDEVRVDEIEAAVGPSLILMTPIGPIRGDIGYRITDIVSDQPEVAYHIAIGHPF